ncbi:MFS transporter [Nocardioides sp. CER19]|uniref:MFS transporter n=1 Tax=Nocardioides sp. CER19 TaxID=3038538 RepID=UPI0024484038|nr:MFS transporter [Nocardioides sp. CER19]MDH2413298.1 MFS transporter [Nocardioides sp. CER19]
MSSFRHLARNHDFTVLWLGQTISDLGSRVSTFVYPLLGYALTHSAVWAASVEAAYLLGLVGMLLPAGVLADRFDRRRIMRVSSALGVVLYASLVVAGALGALTIGHLLAVALVTGVAAGLFSPAEMSAIATVVEADDMPTAMSQQQARQHVAGLLGAPLGGLLFGLSRWVPFLFDAVSYAVAWVSLGRIRTDLTPAPGPAPRPLRDLSEGGRFTWSQPYLRVLLMWSPLVNLTMNALFFIAILRLVQAGTAPTAIAVVEVVGGICGVVGAAIAPWLIARLPTGRLTLTVAWTMLPLMLPMAFWNTPLVIAAALGVILLLNPAGNAGTSSYRMAITPPPLIGRVQSAMQFTSMMPMPLAPVLAGVLLGWLGGRDAILALVAITALVALIPTLSRSVRSVPRPSEWRSAEAAEPFPA